MAMIQRTTSSASRPLATWKRLIQQVKRNLQRFPADFMFQLDKTEAEVLRSQIATSNEGRGGRRYAPYVFTEQGVAMLSGVLRSGRAIAVNVEIMRAFVELRRVASSYAAIEKRILVVRGRQVMLDEDLADLYGVETRALVQQVRRNEKRFPADLCFSFPWRSSAT